MGTSLNGTSINSTYPGLLKTTDNTELGIASAKVITDGNGNDTPLFLAQEKVIIEEGNQRIEVNGTQLSIKGDTAYMSDPTESNYVYIDGAGGTANIGNATNYLSVDSTDASFVGAVDFSGATVTGLPTSGVTSIIAGTGISVNQATGDVTVSATGGGGGGAPNVITTSISNMEYGPEWDYYQPAGATLAGYGQRVIGTCAYLPAGTYDQFHHWVRTAAADAGSTCNYALYNVDTTSWPVGSALSFKPTTKIVEFTGVDATVTGEKLMNLSSPVTLSAGYYFFGFMFNNGTDGTTFQGSYAGWPGTAEANRARSLHSSNGIPTLYQFATSKLPGDILISSAIGSNSMPSDLSSGFSFGGTSFRVTWGIVAQ